MDLLAHRVIGAAIEVHRTLGPGFTETIYQRALDLELAHAGIPFERQVPISLAYRGRPIGETRVDLVIDRRLVVELMVVDQMTEVHHAELLSCLRLGGFRLGLLFNFKTRVLKDGIKRVIWTP